MLPGVAQALKLIEEADTLTDPDKRKAAWQKVLARIAAEAYWVPLFTYAKYYAYSKDLDFKPTFTPAVDSTLMLAVTLETASMAKVSS